MNKAQYLDELKAQLYFLSGDEREDVVREFSSHIDDTVEARPDLDEERVVERLPPPASVAARYQSEAGGARSSGGTGNQGGDRADRARRGFSFSDLGSMFRFARREELELSGGSDAPVERIRVESSACDVSASAGETFAYAIRGRWSDADAPSIGQSGGTWGVDCRGDVDELELTLPSGVVELIVTTASGELSARLPVGTSLKARLASGDVSCRSQGGAVEVSTASGDVAIEGRPGAVTIGTASGDVSVQAGSGDVEAASQSGDISIVLESGEAVAVARSVSGDVDIRIARGSSPEVVAESVSGDVSAPGERVARGPVGGVVRMAGGPGRVYAKTISGDIDIR